MLSFIQTKWNSVLYFPFDKTFAFYIFIEPQHTEKTISRLENRF